MFALGIHLSNWGISTGFGSCGSSKDLETCIRTE